MPLLNDFLFLIYILFLIYTFIMKILLFILSCTVFCFACKNNTPSQNLEQASIKLGTTFEVNTTQSVDEVVAQLSNPNTPLELIQIDGGNNIEGILTQIKGKVTEVCQSAGCWMSFTTAENKEFLVMVRDKSFKLPADIAGKEVIVKGGAYKIVTSIEELRHEAREKGWSQERVLKITAPNTEFFFSCEGIEILP